MSVRHLLEGDVDLILAHLKSNMATALTSLRAERADAAVSTEPPHHTSYFTYYPAMAYNAPAVFVIGETMDLRQADKGANTIAGLAYITVAAIVEDKDQTRLTRKAFRYMNALHSLLDFTQLVNSGGTLKTHVRVARVENGETYASADKRDDPEKVFRKEIALYCEVEHFENY